MAILARLGPAADCTFAGTGSALDLARQSPAAFRTILALERAVDIVDLSGGFDWAVSVMDPWAALWALRHDVPCTYVDILAWAWDWPGVDWDRHRRCAQELRYATNDALMAAVNSDIDPLFLGYLWSTDVFAQRLAHPTKWPAPPVPVTWVGAIIHTAPAIGDNREGRAALVSLSGTLSPLITMPTARRYCRVVTEILLPHRELLGTTRIVVNPRLAPFVNALEWHAQPLSYPAYRDTLASASFLLCPVGLGSVFEAVASNVPVLFLPEQHDLQLSIHEAFACDSPDDFPFLSLSANPADAADLAAVRHDQAALIRLLDRCYERLLGDPRRSGIASLTARLRHWAELLRDEDRRRCITARQRRCIFTAVGDLNGADAIASHVAAAIL